MAAAVEANLFAFFQHLATWPRVTVHDEADCCWTISNLPFPLFNSVVRANVPADRADALIERRIDPCLERGVPMLWWTGPSTSPPDLGARLVAKGFFHEPSVGMAATIGRIDESTPMPMVRIARVSDAASLAEWSRVLCDSFGAPQSFGEAFAEMAHGVGFGRDSAFRHYLARAGNVPVATCSLFLGAGVAGIYDVSTLPEWRRRGIGAAITRFAMLDAFAAGSRTAILHASALGAGMYRSLGFEDICDIGQYVWAPQDYQRS